MTPKERAAMQQALEALESCNVGNWSMAFDEFAVVEAITALQEALAERKVLTMTQEDMVDAIRSAKIEKPVAWFSTRTGQYNTIGEGMPLYVAPVRTKDLTDAFINELHKDAQDPITFARAVIAADREKNK